MPVWHVSVAFHASNGLIPFEQMRRKQIQHGVGLAKSLLQGVGKQTIAFVTNPAGHAIHVQKPLKDDEIQMLPTGWIDIPAVDERGPCTLLRDI